MFTDLMASVRDALRDADEAVSLAVRYHHHPDGGWHAIDAVDGEAYLYRQVAALLRVLGEATVEPGQRFALGYAGPGSGEGSVVFQEIAIRVELEHIQRLTKDKQPRVYLDSAATLSLSCPAQPRAVLAGLPDQLVLALIEGGPDAPAIVELW
jgi:hypothetical protein